MIPMARFVQPTLRRRALGLSLALLLLFVNGACATYDLKAARAREAMRSGSAAQAAKDLETLANAEGDDQLVYLLDYATLLQQAGQFKKSAEAFARAERIADIQDYHSLSKLTSSLVLSEDMVQYKGDDFEKVLINAVNAVNFLELDDLEGALVEVRRLNQKLYRFRFEGKKDYEQNPFAFYLSAVIWEADRKWDDAYIAYKNAYGLVPDYPPLREDLIRSAIRAQRTEELEQWKRKFPEVKIKPEWSDRNMGEIVLIYQQGWGPRKRTRPDSPRFPRLVPTWSSTRGAKLVVEQAGEAASSRVFSVQDVSIKTLEDDYARLVASRVGGVVAKAVVADQIRQRNEALGQLAWIAMNLADRADLRQWSTLPESFQIARLPVRPGKYKVRAIGMNGSGGESYEQMPEREVEVKPGRKAFIGWRSVQ
jgi:uncharacterized protein